MDLQQTVKDFLAPHIQKWLDADHQYHLKKCQIIRAKAEIECFEELREIPKIAKKHKVVKRYERQLEKLGEKAHWTDNVLGGIGDFLVKHFNAHSYEILGPFGLNCETSVWVWATEDDSKERNTEKIKCSITFTPEHLYTSHEEGHKCIGLKLFMKDRSVNTGQYAKNSIAALNGMNYPDVNIEDWTLEKLIESGKKE